MQNRDTGQLPGITGRDLPVGFFSLFQGRFRGKRDHAVQLIIVPFNTLQEVAGQFYTAEFLVRQPLAQLPDGFFVQRLVHHSITLGTR